MRSFAAMTVVLLASCASQPEISGTGLANIELLYGKPRCDFQSLGPVQGGDGHVGVAAGMIWGPRGSDERALNEMKYQAYELGADAVIVLHPKRRRA